MQIQTASTISSIQFDSPQSPRLFLQAHQFQADWKSEMESNLKSERNLKEIWSQKMISQSHEDTCRCPADPSRNLRGKMECGWLRGLLVDSGHIL